MTVLRMIVELVVLGVRFINEEEFSDEQVELTNQVIQLQVTGAELVLCGLAIPLIVGLILYAIRLLRTK